MKVNFIPIVIATAISLLIAYGLYSFYDGGNKLLLSIGSFLFFAPTLITAIGISFPLPRTNLNIKVVSGIFFVIALISNVIFSFFDFSVPTYVLTNGILALIFILTVYSINKAQQ
ncbi:MAG: hypothetical protein LBC68_00595 [Prevotellaceae bacterium]|jgi:hypothetical protein|nr:hypothetical protein [Prevotellaceae bacterium]